MYRQSIHIINDSVNLFFVGKTVIGVKLRLGTNPFRISMLIQNSALEQIFVVRIANNKLKDCVGERAGPVKNKNCLVWEGFEFLENLHGGISGLSYSWVANNQRSPRRSSFIKIIFTGPSNASRWLLARKYSH